MTKNNQSFDTVNEETLKSRLFYVLANCPLFAGQGCASSKKAMRVRTVNIPASDADLVSLHITLPYKLRRDALAAGINCSELMRKALKRRLKKTGRI